MINAGLVGTIIMYIERKLNLNEVLKKKSCFLLGPRQTGKSSLIKHDLAKYPVYNLLDNETFLKLSHSPQKIRQELKPDKKIIIIDEIQKIPTLLDEVHLIIEEYGNRFLLTGSSARKLRRGGVNLLGGRAQIKYFHPLSFYELREKFNLLHAINHGLLPSIYFSSESEEDLKSYAGAYLKEEIAQEALTRNVPAFSRFLEVAALCNGKLINYTNISNDAQVARSTIQEYFQILKDTLIAYEVTPWKKSSKRKPLSTSKLYFFDTGICRFLQNRTKTKLGSPEFGEGFESFIFHELKTYSDYNNLGEVHYWRSKSGFEVDFILNDTAIEVKASKTIGKHDLKGLLALQEEQKLENYILVSLEDKERTIDKIKIMPWEKFLKRLWANELIQ